MSKNKKSSSQSSEKKEEGWSDALFEKYLPKPSFEHIPLSLIIPVYNCSERIGETLESLKRQRYPLLEVIVIDAGSTDRTLEIINSYHSLITRIYTVTDFHPVEMVNRGLALVSGTYSAILFPGTIYMSDTALFALEETAIDSRLPDLVYCGSLQREGNRNPRFMNEDFEKMLLEKGRQPTTWPACWMRTDLFDKMGKFNPAFTQRAAFDFFCRLVKFQDQRIVHLERIYIDFDAGVFSFAKFLKYAADTLRILRLHFGLWKAFTWFLGLNHIGFIRLWFKNLKQKMPAA